MDDAGIELACLQYDDNCVIYGALFRRICSRRFSSSFFGPPRLITHLPFLPISPPNHPFTPPLVFPRIATQRNCQKKNNAPSVLLPNSTMTITNIHIDINSSPTHIFFLFSYLIFNIHIRIHILNNVNVHVRVNANNQTPRSHHTVSPLNCRIFSFLRLVFVLIASSLARRLFLCFGAKLHVLSIVFLHFVLHHQLTPEPFFDHTLILFSFLTIIHALLVQPIHPFALYTTYNPFLPNVKLHPNPRS